MFLQKKTYHIYMFCIVGKRDAFFKTQMVKKHVSREVFIKFLLGKYERHCARQIIL